jgi:hypothetical protein
MIFIGTDHPYLRIGRHILSAIAEGTDCPEFEDVLEMRLHQPMNTSAEVEPSHSITTSSQAIQRDLH